MEHIGIFKEHRDWLLVIANSPGIIFGLTAAITARLYNDMNFCEGTAHPYGWAVFYVY